MSDVRKTPVNRWENFGRYRLCNDDCLVAMRDIPAGSVDLTVTSPPYDNLRTYNGTLEWGEHVWKPVLESLFRVTKTGGVVVWIVNDATIKGSETGTSFRQALYAKEIGFNLHDTMIYSKSSQPRQNGMRYEQQFEYMFIFSRSQPKSRNLIKEPSKNAGKTVKRTCRDNGQDTLTQTENTVAPTKTIGNVWYYGTKHNSTTHPAVFPLSLAQDHILSWSNENDIVLDPFLGSGTTGVACMNLNRRFIGIEKDATYYELAKKRIAEAKECQQKPL